jgi:acyl-CoA thioesterase FadM
LHVYRRPARYDERLELVTTCSKVTTSKIEHIYRLSRCNDGAVIAEGSTKLACVTTDGRVRRMPAFMYPEQSE